jgi:hypothetical protein
LSLIAGNTFLILCLSHLTLCPPLIPPDFSNLELLVNYGYLQAEGISIGSGSVESQVKQIGHRLKITGASWNSDNVPQVLRHRCSYLNDYLF